MLATELKPHGGRAMPKRCEPKLTHFPIFVRVNGSISDGPTKSGGTSRRPDLSGRVGVLPREAKVEHKDVSHRQRQTSDGKV